MIQAVAFGSVATFWATHTRAEGLRDRRAVVESLNEIAAHDRLKQGTPAQRRHALANALHQARSLGPSGLTPALKRQLKTLSNTAFEERHGAPRRVYAQMVSVERALESDAASPQAQRAAKRISRTASAYHRPQAFKLRERAERARTLAEYERAVATSRLPGATVSVELETALTYQFLNLIELKGDGKIGQLIDAVENNPPPNVRPDSSAELANLNQEYRRALARLTQYAKKHRRSVNDLTWDDIGQLSDGEVLQEILLIRSVAGLEQKFAENRSIPNIQFSRKKRSVNLAEPLTIDGKAYRAGRVELPPMFQLRVEFASPSDMKILDRIEAHLTRRGKAGTISQDAYALVRALDSDMKHQHIHIPFRLPKDGPLSSLLTATLVDHWRRSNLLGELLTLRSDGRLKKNATLTNVSFDYADSNSLRKLFFHLRDQPYLYPDELKMAAVGFRLGIYTDLKSGAPEPNLVGYEVRAINTRHGSAEQRTAWLNALQRGLITGHYGIGPETLRSWHGARFRNTKTTDDEAESLVNLHYNRPNYLLMQQLPRDLREKLPQRVANAITNAADQNYGLKMLLHDWSADTIWLALPKPQRAAAKQRVIDAQRVALKWMTDGDSIENALKFFVRRSELLEVVARSLGIRGQELEHFSENR